MLKNVQFMSLSDVLRLGPASDRAVLSIGAPGEELPALAACVKVKRIEFDDLAEDWLGLAVGTVPESTEDGSRVTWHGFHLPMAQDVEQILAFVAEVQANSRELSLVVHCHSGISRSVAIADFVSRSYGIPLLNSVVNTDVANPRLKRILEKVKVGSGLVKAKTAPNIDTIKKKQ